jgi:hypothetical protein
MKLTAFMDSPDGTRAIVFEAELAIPVSSGEMTLTAIAMLDRVLLETQIAGGRTRLTVDIEYFDPRLAGRTRADLLAQHHAATRALRELREVLQPGATANDKTPSPNDRSDAWIGRNDELVHGCLLEADPTLQGRLRLHEVEAWTDTQCRAALEWAAGINLAREIGDNTDLDTPARPGFLPGAVKWKS